MEFQFRKFFFQENKEVFTIVDDMFSVQVDGGNFPVRLLHDLSVYFLHSIFLLISGAKLRIITLTGFT